MRLTCVLVVVLAVACVHEDPYSVTPPDPLGPATDAIPRRLTFNTGDDRSPSLSSDGRLAFARYDPVASPKPCIAYLPVEGGTLGGTYCPPRPTPADTFESTWGWPTLSADGEQVAFLWQRAGTAAELAPWTSELVVAPATSPGSPTARVNLIRIVADSSFTSMMEPAWVNAGTIRLLTAYDSIWKVKGGGAERFTDTAQVARRLMDVDLATGTMTLVPGSDSGIAWTPRANNAFWIVRADGRLFEVSGGVPVERGTFGGVVSDLAEVGDVIVAARGDSIVEWLDPATGTVGQIAMPGPVRRVSPAGGRRFVAEVERGMDQFGMPANLWLWELP